MIIIFVVFINQLIDYPINRARAFEGNSGEILSSSPWKTYIVGTQ